MKTETWYRANDGKGFTTASACEEYEKRQEELRKRMQDFSVMDVAKLEKLIQDLKEAQQNAYNPEIIDTMGSVQSRAIFYMKGVCARFVKEHESYRMI